MYSDIFVKRTWITCDEIDGIVEGKRDGNGRYPEKVVKKVAKYWVSQLSEQNDWKRANDRIFLQRSIKQLGLAKMRRLVNIVEDVYGE